MPAKILVIDDDVQLAFGMNSMLKRAGFTTKVAHNGYDGIQMAASFSPDLIVCDVMMPEMNGFEVLEKLSHGHTISGTPFVFLTARSAQGDKLTGLRKGADDYITKPFLPEELLLRIEAILRRRNLTTQKASEGFEGKFKELQQELAQLHRAQHSKSTIDEDFIEGLVHMLKLRDNETEEHAHRVLELSERMGIALGMKGDDLKHLRWGAVLHDIGKIAIPDNILNKPGSFTPKERYIMQRHVEFANEVLTPLNLPEAVLDIPRYHHEKWNGSGYLKGLSGLEIPLAARIFAIVDVWDALSSDRPYRQKWEITRVIEYIEHEKGKHFDPHLVDIFLDIMTQE